MTDSPDQNARATEGAKPASAPQKSRAEIKDDRRAAALKANMARRKAQTRAREADTETNTKDE